MGPVSPSRVKKYKCNEVFAEFYKRNRNFLTETIRCAKRNYQMNNYSFNCKNDIKRTWKLMNE